MSNSSEPFIFKEFHSDEQMANWLANYAPDDLEELKKKYPPDQYKAELDTINKKVIITKR